MERGWKRAERRLARDVGTRRIPVTGERAGADFASGPFCYQAKVRRSLPAWLFDWLAGVCQAADRRGQTGVLVLNRPRAPRRHAVVILRWSDWVALHGLPGAPDTDQADTPISTRRVDGAAG